MPWHIPEELHHFREITTGHPVIMGRKTWESLPERSRPLPGRENFILSHREPGDWSAGATVVQELPPAGWVIGGGEIYAATIDTADVVEVTVIDANFAEVVGVGAVYAPTIPDSFILDHQTEWRTSEEYRFKFQRWIKHPDCHG